MPAAAARAPVSSMNLRRVYVMKPAPRAMLIRQMPALLGLFFRNVSIGRARSASASAALREYIETKHEPREATLRRVLREELPGDLKRAAGAKEAARGNADSGLCSGEAVQRVLANPYPITWRIRSPVLESRRESAPSPRPQRLASTVFSVTRVPLRTGSPPTICGSRTIRS
jgi:hypothetical protein